MKKYQQVKVIDEENEEEANEEVKDEPVQNDFFIKDQQPNEIRKIARSEKIRKEKERSKTIINFNKLFEAIGWNKDEDNNRSNRSFIQEKEEESKSSSSPEDNKKNSEDELEIFSEDENFLETNSENRRNYFDDSIMFKDNYSF